MFPLANESYNRAQRVQYRLAAVIVLGVIFSPGSNAAKTIYRCERNGQITLTDQPCEGSKPTEATSTTIPSSSTPSTVGIWNGQLQYSGTEAGEMIAAVHTVVPGIHGRRQSDWRQS
jgi:hypothetical protein